ncbi:MAG: glycosyltransferase family 4 protein [Planctomycetia bacterium]|nr:glycosyltransferase family 4 protein [Planctomycetia bacterium]
MRIAHIITRLIIGGAQENTILNCEDLIQDYGDDVLLITGPSEGPEGSLLERVRSGIHWGTSLREPVSGEKSGTVPYVIVPSMIRAIHPWKDFSAYGKIKKILREFKPDVVHTHSAKAGILGRYAARAVNVPVIVHGVHGAPFYPYQNPLVRWFYRKCEQAAARKTDGFVSVADAMTDLMVEGKVAPREKFSTIYSGMEVESFLNSGDLRAESREKLGISPDKVVIGKAARLFHLKGHEYVIEAAKEVVRSCPNAVFLFVGDGILTEPLKKKIREAGLSDYFIFTGLVRPEHIPEMFAAMDIVVHTSLREGLARVLPQGLLSGKPVVSYDIDGAREVVLDGKTGFLLPPGEIPRLAEDLIRLVNDPELRARFGQEGRKRFSKQFDHHFMTERIRSLYVELLKKKMELSGGTRR